jgi:hypothetical protein
MPIHDGGKYGDLTMGSRPMQGSELNTGFQKRRGSNEGYTFDAIR